MKIFFDGGCRPNPGEMEIAVVARGLLHHRSQGPGSSHEAEWLALLHALAVARMLGASNALLLGDSAAVVIQVNGRSRPRDAQAAAFLARFREEALLFERVRVRHIRRTQNLAGIALAKLRDGSAAWKNQR